MTKILNKEQAMKVHELCAEIYKSGFDFGNKLGLRNVDKKQLMVYPYSNTETTEIIKYISTLL